MRKAHNPIGTYVCACGETGSRPHVEKHRKSCPEHALSLLPITRNGAERVIAQELVEAVRDAAALRKAFAEAEMRYHDLRKRCEDAEHEEQRAIRYAEAVGLTAADPAAVRRWLRDPVESKGSEGK